MIPLKEYEKLICGKESPRNSDQCLKRNWGSSVYGGEDATKGLTQGCDKGYRLLSFAPRWISSMSLWRGYHLGEHIWPNQVE